MIRWWFFLFDFTAAIFVSFLSGPDEMCLHPWSNFKSEHLLFRSRENDLLSTVFQVVQLVEVAFSPSETERKWNWWRWHFYYLKEVRLLPARNSLSSMNKISRRYFLALDYRLINCCRYVPTYKLYLQFTYTYIDT